LISYVNQKQIIERNYGEKYESTLWKWNGKPP
jgi:hypothetical protein